jgi:hypothetical protein
VLKASLAKRIVFVSRSLAHVPSEARAPALQGADPVAERPLSLLAQRSRERRRLVRGSSARKAAISGTGHLMRATDASFRLIDQAAECGVWPGVMSPHS